MGLFQRPDGGPADALEILPGSPGLRLGDCHRHHAGGRPRHLQSARLAVPPHRSPVDLHPGLLSRRLGGDGGKQRDPDHRAEDDGSRQDALPVRHQRFGRRRPRRADLRPGDRSGSRLVQGAEQAPARHGQPAGGGPAPGCHGRKSDPELPDHRGPDLGRRQHGRQRPAGLCAVQPGEGPGAGARRGRGGELRLPVCHAPLAEHRQADRLSPDDRGRSRGAQVLQRGGLGRPVRRGAGGAGAAPERLHHRPEHAEDP